VWPVPHYGDFNSSKENLNPLSVHLLSVNCELFPQSTLIVSVKMKYPRDGLLQQWLISVHMDWHWSNPQPWSNRNLGATRNLGAIATLEQPKRKQARDKRAA
jgi:hypothetical protein